MYNGWERLFSGKVLLVLQLRGQQTLTKTVKIKKWRQTLYCTNNYRQETHIHAIYCYWIDWRHQFYWLTWDCDWWNLWQDEYLIGLWLAGFTVRLRCCQKGHYSVGTMTSSRGTFWQLFTAIYTSLYLSLSVSLTNPSLFIFCSLSFSFPSFSSPIGLTNPQDESNWRHGSSQKHYSILSLTFHYILSISLLSFFPITRPSPSGLWEWGMPVGLALSQREGKRREEAMPKKHRENH